MMRLKNGEGFREENQREFEKKSHKEMNLIIIMMVISREIMIKKKIFKIAIQIEMKGLEEIMEERDTKKEELMMND